MTWIQFLAEWAIRSSVLVLAGALLLWVLRVKNSSIRLAVWTALLCTSLALPVLTEALPSLPLVLKQAAPARVEAPIAFDDSPAILQSEPAAKPRARFDWPRGALIVYILVALVLLLRLCVGLALSLRLLRNSRAAGFGVRESDGVTAPVTLGIVHPEIVLPADWRKWDAAKLEAVLAHERSHIMRHDPAVQLLSVIHRALLWHSPLSWFLHRCIVRTAEETSDDAAVFVTQDRALYAEVLLDFMQRGVRRASWIGVPMARYGKVEARIHRILDGTTLSRGVSRWSIAAIVALGAPVAYVVSAAQPQQQPAVASPADSPQKIVKPSAPAAQPARPRPVYLNGLGTVTASSTVIVKARVNGQLTSLGFEEGGPVQAGQVLASIGSGIGDRLARAEADLAQDKARLADNIPKSDVLIAQIKNRINANEVVVDELKLQVAYSEVRSPITGVAGLRMVDPGNMVHDGENIVVVTQVQPIAVLFNIPEDSLAAVLARRKQGISPTVEAWNRDNTVLLATGRLIAVDNLIDTATGTAKLKAVFENKDGRLFPNQFVNVRMLMTK
jgi:multidrug efflux pump subunit AcrA (membrane-fusion protein)/beta-lactamase regulating signal transducer with metallopeptidase domain